MKNREYIHQMEPWFGEEEKNALSAYIDSGGFFTEYKVTSAFEKTLSEYTGAKHCIAVNNGTVSLSIAGLAVGLCPGDEIIIPNYTMIATANAFKMFGIEPIFVDVNPDTLCLDFTALNAALTSKTKAFVVMSANGRYPSEGIKIFEEFAKKNDLVLIEDAAQSLGSYYPDGRHIGTAGKVGSFSFSSSKIISTGQGGCIVTNDDDIADKVRRLKDFGRKEGGIDYHESLGLNFKFTDIQACIGIEQIKKLPKRVLRKKEIYTRYVDNLSSLSQIKFFDQDLENTTPWFVDIKVENREDLINHLHLSGIGTRRMYPPINKQPAYNVFGEHKVSNQIGQDGLWIPSSNQLSDESIDYICDSIKGFYE
jgi:perosamine synthetase